MENNRIKDRIKMFLKNNDIAVCLNVIGEKEKNEFSADEKFIVRITNCNGKIDSHYGDTILLCNMLSLYNTKDNTRVAVLTCGYSGIRSITKSCGDGINITINFDEINMLFNNAIVKNKTLTPKGDYFLIKTDCRSSKNVVLICDKVVIIEESHVLLYKNDEYIDSINSSSIESVMQVSKYK